MNISWMSRSLPTRPLIRYSLWPERYRRRLTTTSPGLIAGTGFSANFLFRLNLPPGSAGDRAEPSAAGSCVAGGFGKLGIFHSDGDFGESQRRALGGAVKNAIGHALGTERLVALFAENPGNGIHDVGFAAAVWPDDAGRAGPAERNYGALAKRLKANDFHFSQLQQDVPFWSSTSPRLPA